MATELTLIFKSLGISQQQYAFRANYDKSYVSRFLNGRRVATQEFIDRLLCEVESHRQTSVTDETRARLCQLRNSALRVHDPDLFKLETMRGEVHKYQREVKRLLLHQEALEGLLERRQAEAEEIRHELAQAQSDWIADRIRGDAEFLLLKGEKQRHQDERQDLLEEIARLRVELKNTVEQKKQAERRCALLEEQAFAVETEVAERRERDEVDYIGVPVELIQARLLKAEESEAYREVAEFALSRTSEDVALLSLWMFSVEMEEHAQRLVTDYCQQRPIRNTVDLVLNVERLKRPNQFERHYTNLADQVQQVVADRSRGDLLEFCALYTEAHRHPREVQGIIRLGHVSYRWFGKHRRLPERAQHFLDIADHLIAIGEPEASADLVRQVITLSGISSLYGKVIAESGREAEIKILVAELLDSIKRRGEDSFHLLPRQIANAVGYSDPLMAGLLLAGLCAAFDPVDLSKILMRSLDSKYSATVTDRIVEAFIAEGVAYEVRNYIAREFTLGVIDDETMKLEYSAPVRRLLEMLSSE
ncbi:helix-turn-helix domain-containing protein [Streptomyces griseoviridis]|uniref:helix-turn-helix domain-containing protein n=1 Tax=Streptomyces griseoviridis TaxID=45398 RepID=UPI0034503393